MTAAPFPPSPPPDPPQPASPARPPFDAYRLPLTRRRGGPGTAAALIAHAVIVLAIFWRGAELFHGGPGRGGGGPSGGGGERLARFLTLPALSTPIAVDVPVPPSLTLTAVPPIVPIPLDLAALELPRLAALSPATAGTGGGAGPGTGGGTGAGTGPGSVAGPGTDGEGGYILDANPRGVILPPVNAPPAVKGRVYRVRFWVAADGRVTRVVVTPELRDEKYRREFIERMMAFQFTPARTRDGQPVASVYTIDITVP
ncbi:MAG: hypothetical protein ACREL9_03060 [Gemmatimonadales bacterium]